MSLSESAAEFVDVRWPEIVPVVAGVLGPDANAHGPNEHLHIPTARKLTRAVGDLLDTHAFR